MPIIWVNEEGIVQNILYDTKSVSAESLKGGIEVESVPTIPPLAEGDTYIMQYDNATRSVSLQIKKGSPEIKPIQKTAEERLADIEGLVGLLLQIQLEKEGLL